MRQCHWYSYTTCIIMGELSLFVIMVQHHDMQHIAEGGGEMLARETVSLVLLLVLLFVSVTPMGELSLFVIMVQHHDMQHIAEGGGGGDVGS